MNNVIISLGTTLSTTPGWIRPVAGFPYSSKTGLNSINVVTSNSQRQLWSHCLLKFEKNVFKSSNNNLLGVVYRSSKTDIDTFNDHLSNIISILKTDRKSCYLFGDFRGLLIKCSLYHYSLPLPSLRGSLVALQRWFITNFAIKSWI